jgi:hypothetical protein
MKSGCGIVILLLSGLFCCWFFYLRTKKENRLMKQGYAVVEKVEAFRKQYGRLPDSLAQVDIKEDEQTETHLSYTKQDCKYYSIWIGISFEESRFYYSDTGCWEHYFREMKKVPLSY